MLMGCAAGESQNTPDPTPVDPPVEESPHEPASDPVVYLQCEVAKMIETKDCKVYILHCEDDSTQLAVMCRIVLSPGGPPVPRPI